MSKRDKSYNVISREDGTIRDMIPVGDPGRGDAADGKVPTFGAEPGQGSGGGHHLGNAGTKRQQGSRR